MMPKLKVEFYSVDDDEGQTWIHFQDETGKWFEIPDCELDTFEEVEAIANNFENEWEARVGQYLEDKVEEE